MDRETIGDVVAAADLNFAASVEFAGQRRHFRTGLGVAYGHHGELFQGVFQGRDKRLRRGLVTCPCGLFKSEATFRADTTGVLEVEPAGRAKTLKAVRLALARAGKGHFGGVLRLRSNIPPGWGLGSSTCDVTAAVRAVADAFGMKWTPHDVASLAVQAEIASDSIMFEEGVVLFAQREGAVIEDFGMPLPGLEVLGFNTDRTGDGVSTLDFSPARYTSWEIEAFRPLVGLFRRAVQLQSARLLGQVATASAALNQQYLPKPHFERLKDIADASGAVGLQVAHTGTVVGLLFDPGDSFREARIQHARKMLGEVGITRTWFFHTAERFGAFEKGESACQ
ncbi:MAG TPA: hypothetical protein VF668_08160 [Pyrinomonadaceae bacterium]|jgi:uncharacterized protein involved in propanediol utilization